MDDPDDRAMLEGRVARALEIARRRSGRTQEEMVRALSPYQSRPARHQQRWHDWTSRPRSVSSLALISAARLARTTVDALLAEAGELPSLPDSLGDDLGSRVAGIETQLASFMEVVARLQETVETQGTILDRLAERAGLPRHAPTREADDAGTLAGRPEQT